MKFTAFKSYSAKKKLISVEVFSTTIHRNISGFLMDSGFDGNPGFDGLFKC